MSNIDKSEIVEVFLKCCLIVQSALFLLKLLGVLKIEWYAVFFPSYAAAAVIFFLVVITIIAYAIILKHMKNNGYEKEDIDRFIEEVKKAAEKERKNAKRK